jgi:holo-[acyl-carrier protein] synthase
MITGIGIDIIETDRFQRWHSYSFMQLKKIYSDDEISYCLSAQRKSAERFAVRFAAKEAFFKALSSATPTTRPLLTVCKAVSIVPNDERPQLSVDWSALRLDPMRVHFSLSHNRTTAVAMVTLERE